MKKFDRSKIKAMFDGKCAYCGVELGGKFHIDHISPVRRKIKYNKKNGCLVTLPECYVQSNDCEENVFPSCAPCNLYKGGYPLEEWRNVLAGSAKGLTRDSSRFRHAVRFGLVTINEPRVEFHFEKIGEVRKVEV